ncbi:hypothetical protein ABT56_06475 [Photobacterium aquae]|uniref:Uncharacterized protein n=1 Tax=Photobacterium aquae TaxID=1195763 RepID=A0A0J1JY54_9GAMM|nr:hypothetical protein [Photobacterium aquae]KLV07182.1 hypothetical protein ABT56_06475 [Photobacterium aquae]
MDNFAAAEKALAAMLKGVEQKNGSVSVDTKTGVVKEERVDYRQVLIDFADEVPGRQKAVIKRMPIQKINNLIAVLHEFKEEARQVRMTEILALMEKDGVHPEELFAEQDEAL